MCVCSLSYPARNAHAPCCLSVACPAPQYFCTLSDKPQEFRKKKVTEHNVCFFCTTFVWNISHCKKNPASCYHNCTYVGLHVNCRVLLSDFQENLNFIDRFSKNAHQISRVSVQWKPSCSMWADRQTDRHKETNSSFSQCCEKRLKRLFLYTALADWFLHQRRSVYCAVRPVYCAVNTVYCGVWTVYCPVRTVYCAVRTVYCVVWTVYCAVRTAYCAVRTIYCAVGLLIARYGLLIAPRHHKTHSALKGPGSTPNIWRHRLTRWRKFNLESKANLLSLSLSPPLSLPQWAGDCDGVQLIAQ